MDRPRRFLIDKVLTPIGTAQLVADEEGHLRLFGWREHDERWQKDLRTHYGDVVLVGQHNPFGLTAAIESYFAGDVRAIDALPVAFSGTPFQCKVWYALRAIPAGGTLSYNVLAGRIGEPRAVRAVGRANGANPIALVVPCHRVIGSDGSLTGYGGGIERKRWLLAHEARHAGEGLFRQGASG